MLINRRKFVQQVSVAGGAVFASPLLPAHVDDTKEATLTILHTNDTHSRLEPFPADAGRNAGLGGVAARAELIKQIRNETEQVLLLDAGDIFQGTPYFNVFKGEPEIKAMTMMGYDACTIGEHDLYAGVENLALQLQYANFPVLLCNYDFTNTPMEGKCLAYKIFDKGNIRVGVLGIGIKLEGLIANNLFEKTIYKNPVECANATADLLRRKECDLIICLSHLGDKYDEPSLVSDEILAKECYDIDLIIGGHTHRFFNKPKIYTNKRGHTTLVNQVGWAGIELGRLDYSFSRTRRKRLLRTATVVLGKKTSE